MLAPAFRAADAASVSSSPRAVKRSASAPSSERTSWKWLVERMQMSRKMACCHRQVLVMVAW